MIVHRSTELGDWVLWTRVMTEDFICRINARTWSVTANVFVCMLLFVYLCEDHFEPDLEMIL